MGVSNADAMDVRDGFQHIAIHNFFVWAAVNEGQRQLVPKLKQHENVHTETLVDFADNLSQLVLSPISVAQFNAKKQVRCRFGPLHGGLKQRIGLPHFFRCQLKQQVNAFPMTDISPVMV